jgi:TolA-binding protein
MALDPNLVGVLLGALGMGGLAGAVFAYRKLPSEIESISVTAAQGAVGALQSALQYQRQLVNDQADRIAEDEARIDHLEECNKKLTKRVRHLEDVIRQHGLDDEL